MINSRGYPRACHENSTLVKLRNAGSRITPRPPRSYRSANTSVSRYAKARITKLACPQMLLALVLARTPRNSNGLRSLTIVSLNLPAACRMLGNEATHSPRSFFLDTPNCACCPIMTALNEAPLDIAFLGVAPWVRV